MSMIPKTNYDDMLDHQRDIMRKYAEEKEKRDIYNQMKGLGAAGVGREIEAVASSPYMLIVYKINQGYTKYFCASDEEAMELARKFMADPGNLQVSIFERTQTWEREWQKR